MEYSITQIGKKLEQIVQKAVTSELGIAKEKIGMGIPGQAQGLIVCLYLYDFRKNTWIQSQSMETVDLTRQRYPSKYYDLYFLITFHSEGDMQFRMEEELKIMDILLRWLGDVSILESDNRGTKTPQFEIHDPDLEEKVKIWSGLTQPMQPAVYCKVGPVEVVSDRTKRISRVTDIQMNYEEEAT